MELWHSIRGFVVGIAAFLFCPCHLVFTIPLFLLLAGGTAVGAWVANNSTIIYAISTVLFVGGLLLAFRWLMTDDDAKACVVDPQGN